MPIINKNTRSLSLTNFKTNVDKPSKLTKPKSEFNFQLPKILDKKINASDKASPITIAKFSGKFLK
jgi:hypothetical protein